MKRKVEGARMNRYGNLWLTVLIYVLGIVALLTILSGWFQ